MNKLLLSLVLAAVLSPLSAQVKTTTFVADLSPSSQNPPIAGVDASGHAAITITTVWEDGQAISGIADFRIMWAFGQTEDIVALHIHNGVAGVNAPVFIGSGFSGPVPAGPGSGTFLQSTGEITDPAMLARLERVRENPAGFYVNLHTLSSGRGLLRGNLRPADHMMLLTSLQKLTAIEEQSAEIGTIKANVAAIARRIGLVPVE